MALMCGCDLYDDSDYWVWRPNDYKEMPAFKRRKRCSSCKKLIDPGEVVTEYANTRYANCDVETSIYGDGPEAIQLASNWLCERCSDLAFSLEELGFCIDPKSDMREDVKEYSALSRG